MLIRWRRDRWVRIRCSRRIYVWILSRVEVGLMGTMVDVAVAGDGVAHVGKLAGKKMETDEFFQGLFCK